MGARQSGARPPAGCAPEKSSRESGGGGVRTAYTVHGQVRAACSAAASAALAPGHQPASHGVTSAPPSVPPQGRQFLDTEAERWGCGGAGKPGRKETPASGEGQGGPTTPSAAHRFLGAGEAGEEEEGWAGATKGIFLSRLESDAGGIRPPPFPPRRRELTSFPWGRFAHVTNSPPYPPSSPVPSSFRAPNPAGQDSGCDATPSFGERRPQPQTPGARGLGGGTSQPPERCPTRETHVMKPGEGGQVVPSLPGSGQTC